MCIYTYVRVYMYIYIYEYMKAGEYKQLLLAIPREAPVVEMSCE